MSAEQCSAWLEMLWNDSKVTVVWFHFSRMLTAIHTVSPDTLGLFAALIRLSFALLWLWNRSKANKLFDNPLITFSPPTHRMGHSPWQCQQCQAPCSYCDRRMPVAQVSWLSGSSLPVKLKWETLSSWYKTQDFLNLLGTRPNNRREVWASVLFIQLSYVGHTDVLHCSEMKWR